MGRGGDPLLLSGREKGAVNNCGSGRIIRTEVRRRGERRFSRKNNNQIDILLTNRCNYLHNHEHEIKTLA